jgi:uncharacterized membrane protein YphA (DoxX/SURF4 family)
MNVYGAVAQYLLATVFLMAGVAKLADRSGFERAVVNYRILPSALARRVGQFLPYVEVVGAALLFSGFFKVLVSGMLLGLLLVFTVAVVVNLIRGRELDCGCFGTVAEAKLSWLTVGRNILLSGLALLVFASSVAVGRGLLWVVPSAVRGQEGVAALIVGSTVTILTLLLSEARRVRSLTHRFELSYSGSVRQ